MWLPLDKLSYSYLTISVTSLESIISTSSFARNLCPREVHLPLYQFHMSPPFSPTFRPLRKLRAFYCLNFSGLRCPISIHFLVQATRPLPFNPPSSMPAVFLKRSLEMHVSLLLKRWMTPHCLENEI